MSDTAHSDAPLSKERAPKRQSFFRRGFRWFRRSIYVLLALIALLLLFTQTGLFRSLARDLAEDLVNEALNAHLQIGSIEGNLFSGLSVLDVGLIRDGKPIARIRRIDLQYDLLSLPWKMITVRSLTIHDPEISLMRDREGKWNIDGLARDTTTSPSKTPFDWTILVRNLSIVGGRIRVYDSTTVAPVDAFSPTHLALDSLTLTLGGWFSPQRKSLYLSRLSWVDAGGGVSLRKLDVTAHLTPDSVIIRRLGIQTDRSALRLSVRVAGIDPLASFSMEQLYSAPLRIAVRTAPLDMRDLAWFIPATSMLGSQAHMRLRAMGTLRDLTVDTLALRTENTSVVFRGKVRDIDKGGDLVVDVVAEDAAFDGADLPRVLPGIPLPDYSEVGPLRCGSISFTGQPLRFSASVKNVTSRVGGFSGDLRMDLRGKELQYKGSATTHDLDLAPILKDPTLRSDLSVTATIEGSGTKLGRVRAQGSLSIDSSSLQQYGVRHGRVVFQAQPDSVTVIADLTSNVGDIRFTGGTRLRGDSIVGFAVHSAVHDLNLGRLLREPTQDSRLNFTVSAHGDGIDLDRSSLETHLVIDHSEFGTQRILPDTIAVILDQSQPTRRSLRIESQYADADFRGQWDFSRLLALAGLLADSLSSNVEQLSLSVVPEPQVPTTPNRTHRRDRTMVPDTTTAVDLAYSLTLKNPERIGRYFGASTMVLRGAYTGRLRGGWQGLDLDGDLRLSDLYYIDSSRAVLAAGTRVIYEVRNLRPEHLLDSLRLRVVANASDFRLPSIKASKTMADLRFERRELTWKVKTLLDTLLSVDMAGSARKDNSHVRIVLPTLSVGYAGQGWSLREPLLASVDSARIHIETLKMGHEKAEVMVEGERHFDGRNNLTLRAEGVDVGDVEYLLTRDPRARKKKSFAGTASVELQVQGDDAKPQLAADVHIDSLAYAGRVFGTFGMDGRYDEERVEVQGQLDYRPSDRARTRVFFASGSLPVAISFVPEGKREVLGTANLRIQMKQFPLELVEKFLGLFSPLTGEANADITVRGVGGDPDISGFLTVNGAQGRFRLNNMVYTMDLDLRPEGKILALKNLTIANQPGDWSSGRLTTMGRIALNQYRIASIDLDIDGRLKVLRRASRAANRTVYGDLYTSIGEQGLRFSGSPGSSSLRGAIRVDEGNLVLTTEGSAETVSSYSNITYVVVDDTTKRKTSSLGAGSLASDGTLFGRVVDADSTQNGADTQSLMAVLLYDIGVRTDGTLRVVIPFSTISQEELNAKIRIDDFKITNLNGQAAFVGDVSLVGDSYYLFLGKRFQATGALKFSGRPDNPDLDLRAVYSDYHQAAETGARRKVFVVITIRGTKDKPELTFDMRWDAEDGEKIGGGGDVQSDAFSFIVFGLFTSDLTTGSNKGKIFDQAQGISATLTSSLLSTTASEFIARMGLQDYIKRVDIGGLGTQDARIKVPIEIGKIVFVYDGQINSPGNSDLVLEVPLGFGLILATNLKTTVTSNEITTTPQEPTTWGVKFLYRISF